jgi:hypothetical protein
MALPTFSLSKRWNVARLTSCISSSPRTKRFAVSAVGIVVPDALPNSERPSPAAPNTVTAATLVVRFFLEARLICRMVASSLVNALSMASLRGDVPVNR